MTASPSSNGRHQRVGRLIEDIFIILCIFVLWPRILGWQSPIFTLLEYIALIGLAWILVRRVRAIREHHPDGEDRG
ncbi:MAG: hypothetical protein HY709_12190 [Candidatus Latescibacteria bacterium]|nr:hypothetical protein [Candidatus Latescibacterota bacterium]